jgi:hypothetical protein
MNPSRFHEYINQGQSRMAPPFPHEEGPGFNIELKGLPRRRPLGRPITQIYRNEPNAKTPDAGPV